ncbi:MAG TPA: glucoamylase family protein [Pirellulaceae bacterium]|nr:glucoamylase family protein [Pirellulaceae bacterium]
MKRWHGDLPRRMFSWLTAAQRERLGDTGQQPLRSELFSAVQLERHAKALAGRHEVDPRTGSDHLLSRLEKNETVLLEAHQMIVATVAANRRMSPADEWLLDNFYLIEEQIRTTRRHLPKTYSTELPRLLKGPSAGFPRVYDIALELISHVDGRITAESLASVVAAYQTVTPLTLGELWAIPIMLRLALIENLRRVAARMTAARLHRDQANAWANQMIEAVEQNPRGLVLVMAELTRAGPAMDSEFAAEFARRLHEHPHAMALPLMWLEHQLADRAITVEQLMQIEGQQQAADQVSLGNSISSLRFLSAMNWRKFVEALSMVEQTLCNYSRGEPADSDVYSEMDFATRDRYRHAVEKVAKHSPLAEWEVAAEAVRLARQEADLTGARERSAHVGFFLIDQGLPQLEAAVHARISLAEKLQRVAKRHPLLLYLGAITSITLAVTATALFQTSHTEVGVGLLAFMTPLVLLSASHLGVAIVNWLVTLCVTPKALPRMDFSEGIPRACRTFVAIPTMLTSSQAVSGLVEALEVRYLANRDKHLHFGLLTDWRDAASEAMPEDHALLERAREGIESLNEKYKGERNDIFFLLHRPRRWNAQERVWMGYERKRGKLADLNAFLRGGARDRFSLIVGNTSSLGEVKYVITLDSDTQLPRESAHRLVATLAHPLNRPRFDDTRNLLRDGYSILQPRVALSLPGARRSWFVRIFGGQAGIDPYTGAVSDVYQDWFQEGSFIGKGIYDVDAFERLLGDRFPENLILSHDLLEGCHARSALISDIELYEGYPAQYSADTSRRHRWIRGDWQIAMWVLPWAPGQRGTLQTNLLSALSRWKIFDNLRRSLVPAALLFLLSLSWTIPGWPASAWILLVLAIMYLPVVLRVFVELIQRPADLSWRLHLRDVLRSLRRYTAQAVCALAFLPHEAYYSLDAVLRTLTRLTITRRDLLQWRTSTDAEQSARTDLAGTLRAMWVAPAAALILGGYIVQFRADALPSSLPLLGLWLVSPAIAWWLSRPLPSSTAGLNQHDTEFLEEISRTTWRFFETFFSPEDNWLPPDNFQEYPVAVIAHRTSPTNMGLALLSNLAAYDFGFITAGQLEERTANTFATMERLERFRGHFFNWYDTRTLAPLAPHYVSTVDSGNLVGHLLTLREGLLQLADRRILPGTALNGLNITLRVLLTAVRDTGPAEHQSTGSASGHAGPRALEDLRQLQQEFLEASPTFAASSRLLARLAGNEHTVITELMLHPDEQVRWWATALTRQAQAWLDEVNLLAPLAALPPPPSSLWHGTASQEADSLTELRASLERLNNEGTLRHIAHLSLDLSAVLDAALAKASEHRAWLTQLKLRINEVSTYAAARMAAHEKLARACLELSDAELDFLFDSSRQLLAIGFNVADHRRDDGFYDLLASEARLTSFVAIAQGQLRQEHWFALGRLLTGVDGATTLLSWSGSMFEYLMPLLVMPSFEHTLLDQTCKSAVARHIAYGTSRKIPWGMSESGYNLTDAHLNYQYRAFGVPGLGLKRGLADDLVLAPYASLMALMVAPQAACANLRRMTAAGFAGRYGYYEAVDYTPARLARGQTLAIVRSFMAHHQGMSFLSLAYVLLDRPMQRRFEAYPPFQATALLLHERIPKATPVYLRSAESAEVSRPAAGAEVLMRVLNTAHTPIPEVQLLSNGNYHVMMTNAGSGYSRWKDIAVTRWREDVARDDMGTFCYLRDVTSNDVWSVGFQPTLKPSSTYAAIFPQSRAEFRRRDFELETHTEVTVSPEDDVELRRISITNNSRSRRTIELTSYAEVVLASAAADATHPAFSNLFVQTEIIRDRQAILCTRRPRSHQEHPPWMLHLMSVHGTAVGTTSYETDRAKFLGRGRGVADPQAMTRQALLSNSEGSVLDPIVAIRCTVSVEPGETAVVDVVTGVAETRDAAMRLVEKCHDRHLADRLLNLAWTHGQVILQQLNATEAEAQLYGRLASSIIYASGLRRASASVLANNVRGQSGLWGHGISGDLPIVLLRIADHSKTDLVRQLIQAHAYWRFKGLTVDLVIWNEDQSGYRQSLQDEIVSLIAGSTEDHVAERPGGIFVRRPEQMSDEDRILMQSVARVVLTDRGGVLADQIDRRGRREISMPALVPTRNRRGEVAATPELPFRELICANGLGGFTADGREYVITTRRSQRTPAPWANVLANPQFGSVVTESGLGYTWFENAHEFRITPWYNDPVTDRSGELFYLRDQESGRCWSPTPLPAPGQNPYVTRHGFGYSIFETTENEIKTELTVYVAMDAPIKFYSLKVHNTSERTRRLSATCCMELVLGDLRPKSLMYVVTEVDPMTGALLARNPYNSEFPGRVAFLDLSEPQRTITGDRTEFFGRNGTAANPSAMGRTRLSGKVGPGLDPCGAMQAEFEIAPGQEHEIVFTLGAAASVEEARELIQRHRGVGPAREALEGVWHYWQRTLGTVYVETPDQGINTLVNGWLLYQTLACRLWGRSGYYQSGGAFGFRDQLQDIMALVHAEPGLMREHLLRAAAHQFVQGDVQHWWHPPNGRGVRTHFSDDYLWLPLATSLYVKQVGDTGVLDEQVPFIEGRPVQPSEEAYYDLPSRSDQSASVYEHCVRAIENGLRFGEHGLPLMGCGDWNDGMNLVGAEGKGESVWLAFFLVHVLQEFSAVAQLRNDAAFAEKCLAHAAQLTANIESNAWDGEWYRRAYFDSGEPLGSASNLECQIDSIPQSWSVLSGAGDPKRIRQAMQAVNDRLVRREHSLIQLFDPPFDKSPLDPGYIKGYVPGVRENGGQYTHAAIWTVMAFAALGDKQRAWELLGLISPLSHGSTPAGIATYKVEPYVVAADVYAVAPHIGRGGWTWYTGSASWMYRLIVESLLGLRLEVDRLLFFPCLPDEWRSFKLHYRYRDTFYHITIQNNGGGETSRVTLDGIEQLDKAIPLVDDRQDHSAEIEIG